LVDSVESMKMHGLAKAKLNIIYLFINAVVEYVKKKRIYDICLGHFDPWK
jgi:hypothetical protein